MSINYNIINIDNFRATINSKITITCNAGATQSGLVELFTWDNPNTVFIPTRVSGILTARGSFAYTARPTASIGTNATNYNNIVTGAATTIPFSNNSTDVNTVGQFWRIAVVNTAYPGRLSNGTKCYLNITFGGTQGGGNTTFHTVVFSFDGIMVKV